MKNEDLSLNEIYSCIEQGNTGPVRLMQLGQLWTSTHRAGIQPSPRKVQKSYGFDMAGHLAVAPRGLASTWRDAVEAMRELTPPKWPAGEEGTNDERLVGYAHTLFDLGNSLPRNLQLTVVNTDQLKETWLERQLRLDLHEQSEAHQRRLRTEKAHQIDRDWADLERELARTGIEGAVRVGIRRSEDGDAVIGVRELTMLLLHLNGPAHPLHAHKEYRSPTIPAVNTGEFGSR